MLGGAFGDPVLQKNREGNLLFDEGKYDEALGKYQDAQAEAPNAPQLHYNIGNALYKKERFPEALQEFSKAASGGNQELASKAHYNSGNSYFRMQKYQEAVDEYEKSLEINPNDEAAKINLELALNKLEEQQKQEENQNDGEGENEEGDKQDSDQGDESEDSEGENQEGDKNEQDQEESKDKKDGEGQSGDDEPKDVKQEDQGQPEGEEGEPQDQQQGQPAGAQAGGLTEEEAERLLDAMKAGEIESQKKRRIILRGKRYSGNEW
jgi:Ca-activated chloride channel family protein